MIFFDFEVFKEDWLVVCIDSDTKNETVIINSQENLEKFYTKHKTDIWVGYNSSGYDIYVLQSILCGFNPKGISDWIVEKKEAGWKYSTQLRNFPLIVYDIKDRDDKSLKLYEGFMGSAIKESSIPFDIDRKLTVDEIAETIKYCRHDVEQTMLIFVNRFDTFEAKLGLLKMFKLPLSFIGKTDAVLSAYILGARETSKQFEDEFEVVLPECLKVEKYTEVLDWFVNSYENAIREFAQRRKDLLLGIEKESNPTKKRKLQKILNEQFDNSDPRQFKKYFYGRKLKTTVAGIDHVFAWGGLHGAKKQYIDEGHFINIDVTSMYPSIMLQFNLLSRTCDSSKYKIIYENRVKYKAEKNPLQLPLKLVLNTVYGATRQNVSKMYDPRNGALVCVYGQILLLDLLEKLEGHCDIIQSNTDGILIKLKSYDDFEKIDDIVYEWEKRTGLNMEFEEYTKIFQKDVNNYIIVNAEGNYKSTGAYVKKLSLCDYDLPILNKALVNYMLHNIPVERTITDCDELIEFQKIVRVTKEYSGLYHGNELLRETTIRVFASKNKMAGGIRKQKKDTNTFAKVENTPEHCFLDNENILGKKVPEELDKNWYIEKARKRLEDFGL